MTRLRWVGLSLAVLGAAFAADRVMLSAEPELGAPVRTRVQLGPDLEPLIAAFDDAAERPRLVAVLSPGCPVCLSGAQAIVDELLESETGVAVLVVWSEILPFDLRSKIERRIGLFASYENAWPFYDPLRAAAGGVAAALGLPAGEVAWDVYLFYPAGVRWHSGGAPPEPERWFHQQAELDPRRYRTGESLRRELREAAAELAGGAHPTRQAGRGAGDGGGRDPGSGPSDQASAMSSPK